MGDNDSRRVGSHRAGPLLPKVGVFASECLGEAGGVRSVKVEWFVVGDYEDGKGANELGKEVNWRSELGA